jgi:hypothetical protein
LEIARLIYLWLFVDGSELVRGWVNSEEASMKRRLLAALLFSAMGLGAMWGQRSIRPFPRAVFAARTVAIVNNTHNEAVEQGAAEALRRLGKFTVVDDADAADITLTFDKQSEHDGSSSQTTGSDGKPSTSYSLSFSSSIHMAATVKGERLPFYKETTSESKKKAGATCVTDLQQALVSER